MLTKHRLDLSELDAIPADLHLIINSAEEFDIAIGQVARQIAGLI
jgi:hypothetical protein